MTQTSLIGLLLISGFVLVLIASTVGPPGLYQEPAADKQVQIIEDHMSRWTASNLLFAIAALVTAAGLLFLSSQLRETATPWLVWSAGLAYLAGAVLWGVFLYQRQIDPGALFSDYTFSPLTVLMVALLIGSLLIYGIAFLQGGYPSWLGYGTVGLMGLIGLIALIFPGPFFKYFPPQALYLVTLAAGIVLLRR